MIVVLGVAAAGGVGAVLRLVVDGLVGARVAVRYPVATTAINLTGSFVLGLVTGLVAGRLLDPTWQLVLGTGVCGGYTTFSTASVEVVRLAEDRRWSAALAYGLLTLVVAVGLGWAGLVLGLAAGPGV